jgi:single-stranded DNA-binding protein
MADINKVWLSGLVVTPPLFTRLSEKTPLASFTIQINEKFRDKTGQPQIKPNLIRVESLGKSAELVMDRVKEGRRYVVDGYLRQDRMADNDEIRVRSFAVYSDDSVENHTYTEGLNQALKILVHSHDLQSALSKLKVLIENC